MFEVELYSTPDGSIPVIEWLRGLGSAKTATRITDRLERIETGVMGDVKAVGDGVWELRFHFGPGYRVYYSRVGSTVVVLL